jgi:hypothetical protein
MSVDEAPAAEAAPMNEEKGGFVREWVVPIGLGLALGLVVVGGWKYGPQVLASAAAKLVAKKQNSQSADEDDAIEKELRSLGSGARTDLIDAMTDLQPHQIDLKIWVAHELSGEPWFATTSLKELLADAKTAKVDKRAVAAALVDEQSKEVDTELVLPVFEDWLKDSASDDRTVAVPRVEHMWREGMLNSRWEARFKTALLDMAKRVEIADEELAERYILDRASAILALQQSMPDEDAKKLLWATAKDETDDQLVRINSVRSLADGRILDDKDIPDWKQVAAAKDDGVRQAVADNMSKATSPAYDEVVTPLQFDAHFLTRVGAIDSQTRRRRPSMLERFDELTEDHYEWVRFQAMFGAGTFAKMTEGEGARAGIMLNALESAEDPIDVMGAFLGLKLMKDKVFGLKETEVHVQQQDVDEEALKTFMADKPARKQAADQYRALFGGTAAWTDKDRKAALQKLLNHPDPKNVERAKAELDAMTKAGAGK